MTTQTILNEQRLNVAVDGDQNNFDVSPLADGGFVAVWENFRPGFPGEPEIRIAIFNEDGTQRIAEREISGNPTTAKKGPSVAVLSTGEIIAAWIDRQDQARDTLEVRVLQANLTPKFTSAFSLPAPFSNQPNLDSTAVQAFPDGEAIVLGRTPNSNFAMVLDNDQGVVLSPQQVGRSAGSEKTSLATTFDQYLIDAENGSIQTLFTAFRGNSLNVLRLEHYGIDGVIGPNFFNRSGQQDINLGAAGHDTPAEVAVLRNGFLAIVLSNTATTPTPSTSVRVRFFEPRIGSFEFKDLDPSEGPNEVSINAASIPPIQGPPVVPYTDVGKGSITPLAGGGFAVVFEATAQTSPTPQTDIFVQCYDVDRNAVGTPEQVNSTTGVAPSNPRVIPRRDRGFTVIWEADDGPPAGNETGLFCRTFRNIDADPVTPTNPDFFQTDEGVQLRLTVQEMLANDPGLDPALFDVSATAADIVAVNGQAIRDPADNDAILFDPDPGFSGDASVAYKLTDGVNIVEGIAFIDVIPQDRQLDFNPGVTFSGIEDQDLILTRQDLLSLVTNVDAANFDISDWKTDAGTFTFEGTDSYRLTPPADFHGQITISFEVSDGVDSVIGTAEVLIAQRPDAPTGLDSVMRFSDQETAFRHVLSGTDADGDALTFTLNGVNQDHKLPVKGGTIQLVDQNDAPVASNTTGLVTFTEDAALADDQVTSFVFTVTDNSGSSLSGTGTVTLERYTGQSAQTLSGGSGNDLLIGAGGNDRFLPGAGSDRVIGRGGQDTVVFSNRAEDYLLTQNADGSVNVIDKTGADGQTRVSEVEFLEFSDRTVRLDEQLGGGGAVTVVLGDTLTVQEEGPNPTPGAVSVLANDRDVDYGTLTVIAVNHQIFTGSTTVPTLFGSIAMQADGTYSYTLDNANPAVNALTEGQTLTDCIVYSVKDSRGTVHQAALTVTIEGAPGFDTGLVLQSAIFNGADEHLSRTFGIPNSRRKFVFSAWVLRTALGVSQTLVGHNPGPGQAFRIGFTGSDRIELVDIGTGGSGLNYLTQTRYRDIGFYHLLASIDVSDVTSSNRVKLFVNGEEVTNWNTSVDPSDTDTHFNQSGVTYDIGRFGTGHFLNGYLSQVIILDGESIQAGDRVLGDFGSFFDAGSNGKIWSPITDQAAATLAGAAQGNSVALAELIGDGTDASTNGNNFTPNNMSHADNGSANTPSNVHPVISTLDSDAGIAAFDGGLEWTVTNGANGLARTSTSLSSGKWYFEVHSDTAPSSQFVFGMSEVNTPVSAGLPDNGFGLQISNSANMVRYWMLGSFGAELEASVTAGAHTYMMALDFSTGNGWFGRDGQWYGTFSNSPGSTPPTEVFTGNPETGANPTFTFDKTKTFAPSVGRESTITSTRVQRLVFEEGRFNHQIPAGYVPINSANLPDPQTQGADVFNATLYTGNGATQPISGPAFQPDLVWIKNRDQADEHKLVDAIRGATQELSSNSTGIESTDTNGLTSFNLDGFTLGSGANGYNDNSEEFISWSFKTGTHFNIVSYTGNSVAGRAVAHGLPNAPELLIVKSRTGVSGWRVWHSALSGAEFLNLDTTAGKATAASLWNSTVPDVVNFTLGDAAATNNVGDAFIAYLFRSVPGLCKVGSYTGNGSADGPFVSCGFKPAWVMAKRKDSSGNWAVFDLERNIPDPNQFSRLLYANTTDTDIETGDWLRFNAGGFKLRDAEPQLNAANSEYIFLAIADIAGGGNLPPVPGR